MDKRYQIFISSTFADLVEERKAIQQAVLSLDHFPSGMELFPATDDDQWELIKSVIDDSDYYVIVLGGRYGSVNADGVSYTEMEFDYAADQEKPILAFVHSEPAEIKSGKTDQNDDARESLNAFRERVQDGRHVKFWSSTDQLQTAVLQALVTETKKNPQEGWVRASMASDPQALAALRLELDELRKSGPPQNVETLQGGGDEFQAFVEYTFGDWVNPTTEVHDLTLTWDEIFREIGPILMQETTEQKMRSTLAQELRKYFDQKDAVPANFRRATITNESFETIKIQLFALGLVQKGVIKRTPSDTNVYWALTSYGEAYLMQLRALKRGVEGGSSGNP